LMPVTKSSEGEKYQVSWTQEVKKATTFGESLTRITTFIQAEVENDGFLEPDEFLKPDQDGVEPNRFHATRMVSNRGNGCNGCRCSII